MDIGISIFESRLPGYTLSTDRTRLDIPAIHRFLSEEAYWCRGIPLPVTEKAIQNSLCFGVYHDVDPVQQVGFARVITDYATFAYICDVFILNDYHGLGLGKWLVSCIRAHPGLQGLRRWSLATRDAHSLYARYGFQPLSNPERWMQITNPDAYKESRKTEWLTTTDDPTLTYP
jgi:GNAT superfamily N-acetyltransferase